MSVRAPRRIAALIAAPTALAAGIVLASPAQGAGTASEPTYKGSALALRAQLGLAGNSVLDEILPQLVTFPAGGKQTLLELPEDLKDVVGLKVLSVLSGVKDGTLASNAHTTGLDVLGGLVTARVINADCTADGAKIAGDSQIADLTLAGTKVPVDAGPNLKIEIPDAFSAFLTGGITIDEQTTLSDGGLRVRALHVNLVVAPAALEDALDAVSATVRAAAEHVKVALEAATGKSLESLLGLEAKPAAQKAQKSAEKAAQKSHGANSADRAQLRAEAAAPQAPAAPAAPAEAVAPAADTQTLKTDDADLDRSAAAAEDAAASDQAATAESTDQAANAQRAEQAEKGARAEQSGTAGTSDAADAEQSAQQERAAATDAAIAEQQAAAAQAAQQREVARAAATSSNKSDGADLSVPERAAAPAADSDVLGALGVDVVISEVSCAGKPGIAGVDSEPNDLPGTGGNGSASRDIALTGLGLLAAGSAAVLVTLRRRRAIH